MLVRFWPVLVLSGLNGLTHYFMLGSEQDIQQGLEVGGNCSRGKGG